MINYNSINKIYKKNYSIYLDRLIKVLNKYHNTNYKTNFWEPIIGLYIRKILSNFYLEKSINSNRTKNEIKLDIKKIKFAKKYIDLDTNKNFNFLLNKNINFSKIKKNLKIKISFKPKKLDQLLNKIKLTKLKILINFGFSKVLFTESYFNKKNKYLFIIRNFFSFFYLPKINCENYYYNNFTICQNRLNLIDEIKNQNDQLLKKLIFFIPVNYLEGFKLFHDEVKKIPICKAIYTDGDEVKHDFIKFFLGFLRNNKKTKLLIGQHSFRSGLDDYDFYYDYVKSICSYYLTWGWKQKDSVIKNFGSLRIFNSLQKFENLNSDNLRKKSICFILCSYSTYGDCLYDNYFENINAEISRIDLLKNLRRDPELNIYLKPRSGSFLMRNKFKFYKNFNIMNEKTKLHNIYKKFEVIIFERISLGILECIYLDQPFIFYYPNNLYQHKNPKFKSLISLLKKSNLYINNIKDLKNLLNDKNRIIKWWNNKDNIFFRKKLIDNFGSKINKKHLNEIRKMVE